MLGIANNNNFKMKIKTSLSNETVYDYVSISEKGLKNLDDSTEYNGLYPSRIESFDQNDYSIDLINTIDKTHPLNLSSGSAISDNGPILNISLTDDGSLLATFSTCGIVKIWCTETLTQLQSLKDIDETNIDEFYVGCFSRCQTKIATGGKLKDPERWSNEDDDNHILPCPIKIFDLIEGKLLCKLEGHKEEILYIDSIISENRNYFISTSQDGSIIVWEMSKDWSTLIHQRPMEDSNTCMAFGVTFLPQTGNRLFTAACDHFIKIFDLLTGKMIQQFDTPYSCYCDCVKVILPYDINEFPIPECTWFESLNSDNVELNDLNDNKNLITSTKQKPKQKKVLEFFAYLITRGVETVEIVDGIPINTQPNKLILYKLQYPNSSSNEFKIKELRKYGDKINNNHPIPLQEGKDEVYEHKNQYMSNSWMIKISSNGRYLLAPTYDGSVFIFELSTGYLSAILRDHDSVEVRDVKFHPRKKMLFTCGDDGFVKVYLGT